MVCGYDTGRLEIWHQNSMVFWKKVIMGWELTLLFVDQLVKIQCETSALYTLLVGNVRVNGSVCVEGQ